jgi:hypothetical protein
MITFATLVIAGEADSTGNGSSGAFGNGSGSGAGAAAVAAPPERRVAVLSPTGFETVGGDATAGGAGAGGAASAVTAGFAAASFGLRGLSHFSQRIPRVIAAPHMKHFWAINELWVADLTPASHSAAT